MRGRRSRGFSRSRGKSRRGRKRIRSYGSNRGGIRL